MAEGVFYKNGGGKWVEMSRDECKSNFVKGACYPGMGKLGFDRNTDCKNNQFLEMKYALFFRRR